VHITASPGTTVGAGQPVTFSATSANPGTAPYYEWLVNGDTAAAGAADTLTLPAVTGNDTVMLILHTTNTCASPDSAISNIIYRTAQYRRFCCFRPGQYILIP